MIMIIFRVCMLVKSARVQYKIERERATGCRKKKEQKRETPTAHD